MVVPWLVRVGHEISDEAFPSLREAVAHGHRFVSGEIAYVESALVSVEMVIGQTPGLQSDVDKEVP